MELIRHHGREAKWLEIYKVFLEIDGRPFKRCQDLVVNLIMEDIIVLDFDCDYNGTLQSNLLKLEDWRRSI